jgi:hypothetical protein
MSCILNAQQCNIVFRISFLSLATSFYASYNGFYDLALCPGGVFLTSINYWRKPDYSWRRYLDMAYVKLAMSYQLYRAYKSQYMAQYYILMVFAICFYQLGIYYYKKNKYWESTYAHCSLHIISNIANVVLYSGRV